MGLTGWHHSKTGGCERHVTSRTSNRIGLNEPQQFGGGGRTLQRNWAAGGVGGKLHPGPAGAVSWSLSCPCNKTPDIENTCDRKSSSGGEEPASGSQLTGTRSLVEGEAWLCRSMVTGGMGRMLVTVLQTGKQQARPRTTGVGYNPQNPIPFSSIRPCLQTFLR